MKTLLITTIALFFVLPLAAQAPEGDINTRLCHIHDRDQEVRHKIVKHQQSGNIDSLIFYAEQMVEIDLENQQYVASIIDSHGIPANLSEKAYSAIFLTVDHADLDFQKRYFKPLMEAAKQGKIKRSEICTLHDRILMHSNRRQLYGTQTQSRQTIIEGQKIEQQTNYVWPIRRAKSVDKRRSKIGMATMQAQTEAHKKSGYKLVWDKSLSVKEFKQMMNQK